MIETPNKSHTFLWDIGPRKKDFTSSHSSSQQATGYPGKVRDKILTIASKSEEKFLRQKTKDFVFSDKTGVEVAGKILKKQELGELIRKMRQIMRQAKGVGLSANQVGLPFRMFIAEVPDHQGNLKFYALLNPKLEKGKETTGMEEGCLSVPGKYGSVKRSTKIKLTALDKEGRVVRIKAWGLLAHVFQHEVDHLDGKLFTDIAKNLREVPKTGYLEEPGGEIEDK